jgi:predicted AlkP superfamily phosphohydrolase/phosphomutase
MARGLVGELEGVRGFFVGSTWPSLYTGTSPASHGFHYLAQMVPGGYEFYRPAVDGLSLRPPFWWHLSRAGHRVAILDVPLTRLDPGLNGVQVVEWGGHDSVYGFQASPAPLARELRSRFGAHPLGPVCDGRRKTPRQYEAFLDALIQGVNTKADLTRHILDQGGWDLFVQVFTESHCVGHQCWHLHDPAHPAHDPSTAALTGDPLLRVYRAIDRAMGHILGSAGDALVLVFSAHSMSHWFGAQFLLEEILFRLGVAAPALRAATPAEPLSPLLSTLRWGWRKLPAGLREGLAPLRARIRGDGEDPGRLPSLRVDPSRSRCFPVPNGLAVGGIRLNLVGRDPRGILPAEKADAFSAELEADLKAIQDDRTGRPLIKGVYRTREIYSGEHLERLPDLLVEWNDQTPTGSTELAGGAGATVRASSPKIGVVEGKNDYGRSGEHRPDGLFVAAGPGVGAGRLEGAASILDLAPTLTRLLGVELPGCDGVPIPEIVGGGGPEGG